MHSFRTPSDSKPSDIMDSCHNAPQSKKRPSPNNVTNRQTRHKKLYCYMCGSNCHHGSKTCFIKPPWT